MAYHTPQQGYIHPSAYATQQQPYPRHAQLPAPTIGMPSQMPTQAQYQQCNIPSNAINPPSPSMKSEDPDNDAALLSLPGPEPVTKIHRGFAFALTIEQQPQRARMCGFGDKDRRPISPPICVRLIIQDAHTDQEIDYATFEAFERYFVMADLSSVNGTEERNLVSHNSSSPSISSVTTRSYPPTITQSSPAQVSLPNYDIHAIRAYDGKEFSPARPSNPHSARSETYHVNGNGNHSYYTNGSSVSQYGRVPPSPYDSRYQYANSYGQSGSIAPMSGAEHRGSVDSLRTTPSQQTGTCTRNLIGAMCCMAQKLQDENGRAGLWFVFQDMSIRTEGIFRLKFSLFDLKGHHAPDDASAAALTQAAPMLAVIYSNTFKVYSAKKFPGVIESTELSRKFASQGVKIPIRKDTKDGAKPGEKRKRRGGASDDEDDDEDYE